MEMRKPITEELLRIRDRIVMAYPRGGGSLNAYSLAVTRTALLSKDLTEFQSISSGSNIALDKYGESGHNDQVASPGDSVFKLPDTKEPYWMYHFGLAFKPQGYKVYIGFPGEELVQGLYSATKVSVGDDEGYEWSENTVYEDKVPTNAIEIALPPGNDVYIGIDNTRTDSITPRAYMYGLGYEVAPINPVDEEFARKVAKGEVASTPKINGPLDKAWDLNIPSEWGEPVVLDRDEIAMIGGE